MGFIGPLRVTSIGRAVVDVAGGAPFGEGSMAADAVLRSGRPRALLEQAVDPNRLRLKLAAVGVHPASPRATINDSAAAARDARPRFAKGPH